MASCLAISGLVTLSLAVLLTGISVGTPFWIRAKDNTSDFHSGLWMQCKNKTCSEIATGTSTPTWFAVSRIVYAVVAANCVVGLALGIAYVVGTSCLSSTRLLRMLLINILITVLEACTVITMFAVKTDDTTYLDYDQPTTFAWSLIIACCAGGWTCISMIIYIMEISSAKVQRNYRQLKNSATA